LFKTELIFVSSDSCILSHGLASRQSVAYATLDHSFAVRWHNSPVRISSISVASEIL